MRLRCGSLKPRLTIFVTGFPPKAEMISELQKRDGSDMHLWIIEGGCLTDHDSRNYNIVRVALADVHYSYAIR